MILKDGVVMQGLHPVMRAVLRETEILWKRMHHPEGVTITEVCGGVHSAVSWHYYGFALDLRLNYIDKGLVGPDLDGLYLQTVLMELLPDFDIVVHSTHMHIEIGNALAKQLGVYY